ncbi:glycoside hydrolase domain-containing protein [Sphingobacterium puteale]
MWKQEYQHTFEGLVTNEDVGQMSGWYVLATSGYIRLHREACAKNG